MLERPGRHKRVGPIRCTRIGCGSDPFHEVTAYWGIQFEINGLYYGWVSSRPQSCRQGFMRMAEPSLIGPTTQIPGNPFSPVKYPSREQLRSSLRVLVCSTGALGGGVEQIDLLRVAVRFLTGFLPTSPHLLDARCPEP